MSNECVGFCKRSAAGLGLCTLGTCKHAAPEPLRKTLARPLDQLKATQRDLDWLIGITPSGDARNSLTAANIHLLATIDTLKGI